MNKKPKDLKEFIFKYKFSDDYNPVYINGAFGGISTKGELVVHFFLERQGLPTSEVHQITPEGELSLKMKREPADQPFSAIRYIDTGIILSYDSAKNIHKWLGDKINELDKIKQEISKKQTKKK